jgi:putative addiction module CopG family antidote
MTIDLPVDLERFVHDEVQAGRYPSEQEVIRAALEQLRARTPRPSPGPGSIGALRDDAEFLDQAVEHAMRVRERRSWGLNPGE